MRWSVFLILIALAGCTVILPADNPPRSGMDYSDMLCIKPAGIQTSLPASEYAYRAYEPNEDGWTKIDFFRDGKLIFQMEYLNEILPDINRSFEGFIGEIDIERMPDTLSDTEVFNLTWCMNRSTGLKCRSWYFVNSTYILNLIHSSAEERDNMKEVIYSFTEETVCPEATGTQPVEVPQNLTHCGSTGDKHTRQEQNDALECFANAMESCKPALINLTDTWPKELGLQNHSTTSVIWTENVLGRCKFHIYKKDSLFEEYEFSVCSDGSSEYISNPAVYKLDFWRLTFSLCTHHPNFRGKTHYSFM